MSLTLYLKVDHHIWMSLASKSFG